MSIRVPSSRRKSFTAPIHVSSSSSVSSEDPTVRSNVSMAASLPARGESPRFVSNSRLRSGSSLYAAGKRRAIDGSLEGSSSSRSSRDWRQSSASSSRSPVPRLTVNLPFRRRNGPGMSHILLQRRPQTVRVQASHVGFRFLPRPRGDDRPALRVDVPHQALRLLPRVAEELHEHPRHVRHQIDGVVPDDHDPREVGFVDVLVRRPVDVHRRRPDLHGAHGARGALRRPRVIRRIPHLSKGGVATRKSCSGLSHRGTEYSGAMSSRTTFTIASVTVRILRTTQSGRSPWGNPSVSTNPGLTDVTRTVRPSVS